MMRGGKGRREGAYVDVDVDVGVLYLPMVYFFAGGRARAPEVKEAAYCSFDLTRASVRGVDAMLTVFFFCSRGLILNAD